MIIPLRYKLCVALVCLIIFACALTAMMGINDAILAAIPEHPDTAFFYIVVYSAAVALPLGGSIQRLTEKMMQYAYMRIDLHAKKMMSQWLSNHARQNHPGRYKRGDTVNVTLSFTMDEWKIKRGIV